MSLYCHLKHQDTKVIQKHPDNLFRLQSPSEIFELPNQKMIELDEISLYYYLHIEAEKRKKEGSKLGDEHSYKCAISKNNN